MAATVPRFALRASCAVWASSSATRAIRDCASVDCSCARTKVESSNDRYANLEVNFLLQRMERFEGISILTSNMATSIDPAFKRRLRFRLHFELPDAHDRERMWRAMMGMMGRMKLWTSTPPQPRAWAA